MRTHSISHRYFVKLSTNSVGAVLGLVIMSVVPRTLGPAELGRFEFITNNFDAILAFLSLSMPLAYFNWVSKKNGVEELATAVLFISGLTAAVATLFALFIATAQWLNINYSIWPDVPASIIWAAYGLALANFTLQLVSYTADGRGKTVYLEAGRLIANIIRAAAIVGLAVSGSLTIVRYFYLQTAIYGGISIALCIFLTRNIHLSDILKNLARNRKKFSGFALFAWSYSKPLIIYSTCGLLCTVADRWLLQYIGGSTQQGYYALAYRFGALAFIITGAMTSVLSREFALAQEVNDFDRLRSLFEKIRIFYLISSILGVYFFSEARNMVAFFAGDQYSEATLSIAIMGLYPIHQTLGQLSGSFMVSIVQTKLYSKIGSLFIFLSLPVTWFLLANYPGLGLGALGMAIKMTFIQLVSTNVILYFNCKYLNSRNYAGWIRFQILSVVILLAWGTLASQLGKEMASVVFAFWPKQALWGFPPHLIRLAGQMALSLTVYLLGTGVLCGLLPEYLGFSAQEKIRIHSQIKGFFLRG